MKLTMVTPIEVELIWQGEPAQLPLSVVVANMPSQDSSGEEGYPNVGDAGTIHAALLADGVDSVAGWDDDAPEGDACWFEWQPDDYLEDEP